MLIHWSYISPLSVDRRSTELTLEPLLPLPLKSILNSSYVELTYQYQTMLRYYVAFLASYHGQTVADPIEKQIKDKVFGMTI